MNEVYTQDIQPGWNTFNNLIRRFRITWIENDSANYNEKRKLQFRHYTLVHKSKKFPKYLNLKL